MATPREDPKEVLRDAANWLRLGRLTDAAEDFRYALVSAGHRHDRVSIASALAGLGRIAFARDDLTHAARCAEEALKHHPGCVAAMLLLAEINASQGQVYAAAAWRQEARAVQPARPDPPAQPDPPGSASAG